MRALFATMQAGRLKYISTYASMFVRLCDEQRMGHLEDTASSSSVKPYLRIPSYVKENPKIEAELKRIKDGGRTYDSARYMAPFILLLSVTVSLGTFHSVITSLGTFRLVIVCRGVHDGCLPYHCCIHTCGSYYRLVMWQKQDVYPQTPRNQKRYAAAM